MFVKYVKVLILQLQMELNAFIVLSIIAKNVILLQPVPNVKQSIMWYMHQAKIGILVEHVTFKIVIVVLVL